MTIGTPAARSTDPATSHHAADHMDASGQRAYQQRVTVAAVDRFPGCTTQELAEKAGLSERMLSRRLSEVADDGQIKRGSPRATAFANGTTGRPGTTWWPKSQPVQLELVR